MRVLRTVAELRSCRKDLSRTGSSVGFVPTMGCLHEGHLSLMRTARQQNDSVWVSIFVNPTQFGPNEDFERYPRTESRDIELCRECGVEILFIPPAREMYPEGSQTWVEVEHLPKALCGASRPTHFRGVTTVVAKLFNLVQPDRAYFGQKDAQQVIVLDRMTRDLDFPVRLVVCPTVRESDGLALSSRNVYLDAEQREQAVVLSQALAEAEELFEKGERDPNKITEHIHNRIQAMPLARIDYVSVVRTTNLQPAEKLDGGELVALAVFFGTTRLIDNIVLGERSLIDT